MARPHSVTSSNSLAHRVDGSGGDLNDVDLCILSLSDLLGCLKELQRAVENPARILLSVFVVVDDLFHALKRFHRERLKSLLERLNTLLTLLLDDEFTEDLRLLGLQDVRDVLRCKALQPSNLD